MLLWQKAVTDRTQSDVERVLELLEKGWQNFSDAEKSEWNGGLKGALNVSDWLRIQNNVCLLKEVLELDMDVFNMGKNLIPYPFWYKNETYQSNGITWTNLGDGRVIANGTATANSWFTLVARKKPEDLLLFENGTTVTYSGMAKDVGCGGYIQVVDKSTMTLVKSVHDADDKATYTVQNDYGIGLVLYVGSGSTVENAIFEPQLEFGTKATPYERYSGRNMYVPTENVYKELLENVETIRSAYCIYSTTPETPSMPLNTFEKWNTIERILSDVHEILLNNFCYYCGGEIYAGDDTGLLL